MLVHISSLKERLKAYIVYVVACQGPDEPFLYAILSILPLKIISHEYYDLTSKLPKGKMSSYGANRITIIKRAFRQIQASLL